MGLKPNSGRRNAPRDSKGHFLKPISGGADESLQSVEDSPFSHITHPKKRAFLSAYCGNGNQTTSAALAGCSRDIHWYWMQNDPEYAEAYRVAEGIFGAELEAECTRRGKDGVFVDVFDKDGNLTGQRCTYSDTLLIFRTKGALPEKYAERSKNENTHAVTLTITDMVQTLEEMRNQKPADGPQKAGSEGL